MENREKCSITAKLKTFLQIGKSVRSVKTPDIFTSIIPMYYLSKFTGLAPFSLTYTHDKQSRVRVALRTSVPAVLYTVLLIIVITAAQCFVLKFYRNVTHPFGNEKTKQVIVLESVVSGITCITSLANSLKKFGKKWIH